MLVIIQLETQFYTQCTCIFVNYLLTNLYIFSPNASLVIAFKPKAQKSLQGTNKFLLRYAEIIFT